MGPGAGDGYIDTAYKQNFMDGSKRTKDIATEGGEGAELPYDDLGASGLLTRSDRKLLLGLKSYDNSVEERKARQRLRERVWHGLQDFELLVRHLDQRDRVQIFGDITAQVPDDVYRDDEINGMVSTIAFLYAAAHDSGIPFDTVIERALEEATSVALSNPFALQEVDIQITETSDFNLDTIADKIDANIELSESEQRHIKDTLSTSPEEFVQATDHIDLPRQEAYQAGETLSVGESLVLFGRFLQNPWSINPERDGQILHEQIINEFGIKQFLDDIR